MSATVFKLIGVALQSLLTVPPALADGRVWRGRLAPIQAGTPTAIVIRLEKTTGQRAGVAGGPTDWATDYSIEIYARVPSGREPEDQVDDLVDEVFTRLSGAGPLLGLGVMDVLPDPRISWDTAEGQTPIVVASMSTRIIHRTQANRLVAWD